MTMSVNCFLKSLIVNSLLGWTCCERFNVLPESFPSVANGSHSQIVRVPLLKTSYEPNGSILVHPPLNGRTLPEDDTAAAIRTISTRKRKRRMASLAKRQTEENSNDNQGSSFEKDELGWSNINAEVDIIIPMIVAHLQKLGLEHLQLPNMKETIALNPLFITYEAGLFLSNGIVYNLAGVQRSGNAFMTYEGKSFICRFNLLIKTLQFEYDFLIKLMALEGYGKVIGSLDNTIIFGELAINIVDTSFQLNDFRIMGFDHISVELDQRRIIRQLTGVILTPITNFFKDRITTSISDGLKEQMQLVMTDFNDKDPLQLKSFAKQMLSGLVGEEKP